MSRQKCNNALRHSSILHALLGMSACHVLLLHVQCVHVYELVAHRLSDERDKRQLISFKVKETLQHHEMFLVNFSLQHLLPTIRQLVRLIRSSSDSPYMYMCVFTYVRFLKFSLRGCQAKQTSLPSRKQMPPGAPWLLH